MSVGSAAGVAAKQIVDGDVATVQDVDVSKVQAILTRLFRQRIHGPPNHLLTLRAALGGEPGGAARLGGWRSAMSSCSSGASTKGIGGDAPGGAECVALTCGTRYIHTVTESAHKGDLEASVDLLAAWLAGLARLGWPAGQRGRGGLASDRPGIKNEALGSAAFFEIKPLEVVPDPGKGLGPQKWWSLTPKNLQGKREKRKH